MIVPGDIIKEDPGSAKNTTAIISSKSRITYSELDQRIRSTAGWLSSIGVGQHTKAAILSGNSPDYIVFLFALWNLNACVIPLNIMLSGPELTDIINFSDAEFLFYSKDVNKEPDVKIPRYDLNNIASGSADLKAPGIDPEAISLIMFTSGASGNPKGVMHSLNDLLNSADNSHFLLNQTPEDRWIASLPFYHIGGLSIIIRTFRYGSSIAIPSSLKNKDLAGAFKHLKPTLASLVSTQLQRLLESGWNPRKELKNILLGGGFLNKELVGKAVAAGCPVSSVYGSTETSAFVTANDPVRVKNKPLSSGKALGSSKVYILDDKMDRVNAGETGEIFIQSNTLFHGYYKDDKSTAAKLTHGGYLTGDIGYMDDDGDLFMEARRTDLIITGGENVNPIEIETVLNKMPGINDCCVFAQPDEEWGQIVAAAVVLETNISIKEIVEYLKEKIAGYKIPKKFYPVENIPRSVLGKILREIVREECGIL